LAETRDLIRRIKSPVNWFFFISLAVSFASFIVYLADFRFSDDTLLLLLNILRYSSFILFVCSVYILIKNIYRMVNRKKADIMCIMKILGCFILIIYCIVINYLKTFVIVFSGGT